MSTFAWGGRQWGAGDLAAFKKWLATHGANYATWARLHPGAAKTFSAGASAPSVSYADIARQRAEDAIAPGVSGLESERNRTRDYYTGLLEHQGELSQAAAQILAGIAPGVQSTYQGAADATAGYARGLGDIQNEIQAGERAGVAKTLDLAGASPEQQAQVNAKIGSDTAGDVVYGATGYIPAADLQSQGAAATSLAQMLPSKAVAQGEQSRGETMRAMLEEDMKLLAAINAEKAKIPGLSNDFLQQLLENSRSERALQVQEGYFNQSQRKTDADLTGVDPVTGLPTAEVQAGAAKAQDAATGARRSAVKEREDAFATARDDLFNDAAALVTTEKKSDPNRPWLPPVEQKVLPDYATAKKNLFNKYKSLLRYGNRSGQAALKRRLNQIIDEALAAAGITPPKRTSRPKGTRPVGPDKGKPRGG